MRGTRPVFLAALALTLAGACYLGEGPSAPTRCGERLQRSHDVPRLQGLEDIVLRVLAPFGVTCGRLRDWEVEPVSTLDGGGWGDRGVMGLCWCDVRLMQVAAPGWAAYPHELLHAMECPATDDSHATWGPLHYGALDEVAREAADAGL